MKRYDENTNRTLAEMQDIINELRATNSESKINFVELVRDFDGTYYCNMTWHGQRIQLPENVNFKTLINACKLTPGATELPPLKYWKFKQHGRKGYAYLQGMVTAKSCMVEQ